MQQESLGVKLFAALATVALIVAMAWAIGSCGSSSLGVREDACEKSGFASGACNKEIAQEEHAEEVEAEVEEVEEVIKQRQAEEVANALEGR